MIYFDFFSFYFSSFKASLYAPDDRRRHIIIYHRAFQLLHYSKALIYLYAMRHFVFHKGAIIIRVDLRFGRSRPPKQNTFMMKIADETKYFISSLDDSIMSACQRACLTFRSDAEF